MKFYAANKKGLESLTISEITLVFSIAFENARHSQDIDAKKGFFMTCFLL